MAFFEDNSISHNVESNANFRAWASMIHKALEEVGLVNTADTGQINLTTVENPGVGVYAGYEIWRFNDSEQATRPVYIKIEYGVGATKARPAIRFRCGRGSDGAGTLTTQSGTKESVPLGTPSGNGYIHACLYKGAFHIFSCANTSSTGTGNENGPILFCVERMRNAATLATVDAIAFWGGGASSGPSFTETGSGYFAGSWETCVQATPAGTLVVESTLAPGLKIYLEPIPAAPCRSVVGARSEAIGAGDTGELTIAGETLTYKRAPIKKEATLAGGTGGGTNTGHNYLLLHQ